MKSALLLALLFCLVGCDNTPYDISPLPDAPWCDAGKRAVLETYVAPDQRTKTRWDGGGWHTALYESFYSSLGDPLRASKEIAAWPKSRSQTGTFFGPERIAPYQFYVVSLWPTVVIMLPHAYPPTSSLSPADSTGGAEHIVPIKYVNNYAALTTILPAASQIVWYAPGTHSPLTHVTIPPTGTATITAGKATLLLERRGSQLIVTRK